MYYLLYNSKPQTVRAVRFTGSNVTQLRIFMDGAPHQFRLMNDGKYELDIPTSKGLKTVDDGDYVTCDEEGEFRVWSKEEFHKRFDATDGRVELK